MLLTNKSTSLKASTPFQPKISAEKVDTTSCHCTSSLTFIDTEIIPPEFTNLSSNITFKHVSISSYMAKVSEDLFTEPEFSSVIAANFNDKYIDYLEESEISCDEFIAGLSVCFMQIQKLINHQEIYNITAEDLIQLKRLQHDILLELEELKVSITTRNIES
ncbi:hypothetical protein NIES2111_25460 [Nostoc sp. NIES-2111]|nr:hypothetical protein NIES2111_25460 [Nostoc sp. NIES-2111]